MFHTDDSLPVQQMHPECIYTFSHLAILCPVFSVCLPAYPLVQSSQPFKKQTCICYLLMLPCLTIILLHQGPLALHKP